MHHHPKEPHHTTFSHEIVELVWDKAQIVSVRSDKKGYRKDTCGAWIKKSEYGNRDSHYGWEVDHIYPWEKGGSNHLDNLQPLHWHNNESKGTHNLVCSIISEGHMNILVKH